MAIAGSRCRSEGLGANCDPNARGRECDKGCVGQDSNLGTPAGRDLESLAFDRAWLPTRGRAETAVRKTFRVSVASRPPIRGFFVWADFRAAKAASWYITSR